MTKTIRIGISALAAGVVAVSGAMSVQAADMAGRSAAPTKKYVPAYGQDRMSQRRPAGAYSAPVAASRQSKFDWTGVYVGGNVGYDWINSKMQASTEGAAAAITNQFGIDELESMSYGAQVGYLVALDDNIVVGIEGDFTWMDDLERSSVKEGPTEYKFATKLPWLASVRARIGSSLDNYMVYGTGGIAFSDLEHSWTTNLPAAAENIGVGDHAARVVDAEEMTISTEKRVSGWALGGGLEVMLADNLSTRIEYLYYDLGENPYKFSKADPLGGPDLVDVEFDSGTAVENKLTMHAVRVGVNLRF